MFWHHRLVTTSPLLPTATADDSGQPGHSRPGEHAATSRGSRPQALLDQFAQGRPAAVMFAGQGADWAAALTDLVKRFGLRAEASDLVTAAEARLRPCSAELLGAGLWFDPRLLDGSDEGCACTSCASDSATGSCPRRAAGQSLPGVTLTQLLGLRALASAGWDPASAEGLAGVAGHSQGLFAAATLQGSEPGEPLTPVDALMVARLAGAACEIVARRNAPGAMLSLTNITEQELSRVLAGFSQSSPGHRVVRALRNGRRSFVVSGPRDHLRALERHCDLLATESAGRRTRKVTGARPFAPVVEPVLSGTAFHHPDLEPILTLVERWSAACGLDPAVAEALTRAALVDQVDWREQLDELTTSAARAGADWVIDLGPGDLASRLSARELRGSGLGVLSPFTPASADRDGWTDLTAAGATPKREVSWSQWAPRVIRVDGVDRTETAFSRLTGRSPVLLAGMTPTTADPEIVAAAANAGFWAELAGGGQVTEAHFDDSVDRLRGLLDPGQAVQFNALLLDPYLWGLQVGSKKLLQRARQAGAPFDGLVVTAGIPELPDAVALIDEVREAGLTYVAFKPGTVAQIRQVVAIADEVAPFPLLIQIEGGQAGGHHSWEDLDELLLATYADLRARPSLVVCVGGGIGTEAAAAAYLTGDWSRRHDFPAMPVDGVLVGTAAMATREAKTSAGVKDLLVATAGVSPDADEQGWVGVGHSAGGMTSGRSQLGADLHEIDNASGRTGRLLDAVAGDAQAVRERREEIIEALATTAKPYFGDVTEMTYADVVRRFLELDNGVLDPTARTRLARLLQRAEARLHEADHGPIPRVVEDIETLVATYPEAEQVRLHPADLDFFIQTCRLPGKPVPFVPVLDADVRSWWRSDSLWQSHDDRFPADEVCVIPGPVAVAGITQVNEPVAELLARFEDATTRLLQERDPGTTPEVSGRRRFADSGVSPALDVILASPDVEQEGRLRPNPVRQLGPGWQFVSEDRAEHLTSGASLELSAATDAEVILTVPVDASGRAITLRLAISPSCASGAAPVVVEAAAALRELLVTAAGGMLPDTTDEGAELEAEWSPWLAADHAAASGGSWPPVGAIPSPDSLVGTAWPVVFAVLAARDDVAEGILDLVHLDHQISVVHPPVAGERLTIRARLAGVEDTEVGRVAGVDIAITGACGAQARLTERFAVRGRPGSAALPEPVIAGGSGESTSTTRRTRLATTLTAPDAMDAFALASGDHNPIHTNASAARLAGLDAPIVHGMWLSAAVQQRLASATGTPVAGWTARFLGMVRPRDVIEVQAVRTGLRQGAEVIEVIARVAGEIVLAATAKLAAPVTAYTFPGQGIQKKAMGMDGYARSRAARGVWDRADAHTRDVLGFSILQVVQDNPTQMLTGTTSGEGGRVTHRHPDGVLYLTQFTQVAMAVLGAAQVAELRERDAFVEGAYLAGHSVGEYNALAAISGVLSLETVVEVVFQRGSVMHTLVPRDEQGRSDYRLAAIRPAQFGLPDGEVVDFIAGVAEASGEFLEVANFNLRGSQYAVAGTVAGCEALEAEVERRRLAYGGKAAYVLVPGIDVPFHSRVLRGGVPDFRERLDELLPAEIDPAALVGRYIPNLVPRLFSLERDFVEAIAAVVPAAALNDVLDDFERYAAQPGQLARTLLVELLAWQFASPVRWIETQDLLLAHPISGGVGLDRFVEVGLASAPTVANLAASTEKLADFLAAGAQICNSERDFAALVGEDEDPPVAADLEDDTAQPEPQASTSAPAAPVAPPAPTPMRSSEPVADLTVDAADATRLLIALWTKIRPDQLAPGDSIESLCDGASSRRNQLLIDLGAELGLSAIDGAADAELATLTTTVTTLAPRYRPWGSVLGAALGDVLKKALGPIGQRPAAIGQRVSQHWGLGEGWGHLVQASVALSLREGDSVRGGELGGSKLSTTADLDALVDTQVEALAGRLGVTVSAASAVGDDAVDPAAGAALLEQITGTDGVLAGVARDLLDRLGVVEAPSADVAEDLAAAQEELAHVHAELGTAWVQATQPCFEERRAVVLDDWWALARTTLADVASGQDGDVAPDRYAGLGPAVAAQARWWSTRAADPQAAAALAEIAVRATDQARPEYADDVAVVTGASPGSIAASVVARLLGGGATVIVTTSQLSPSRLGFFRGLYADHAAAQAALWVVPANLASFGDVDSLVRWVTQEATESFGPTTSVVKPALRPTLLFPFAAGTVMGEVADVGPRAEIEARVLLWSVERLTTGLALAEEETSVNPEERRLHVVLPGSPNRGHFGGDGAYGEAKAALDSLVTKWHVESRWAQRVGLVHAIIGWTRGTGLMGALDAAAASAHEAGLRTYSTDEMADLLLETCTPQARGQAAGCPTLVDLSGGLSDLEPGALDLRPPVTDEQDLEESSAPVVEMSAALPAPPGSPTLWERALKDIDTESDVRLEDLVVIVGSGELGPWGSSRTRFEAEVGDLSAAGVLELAWSTGLVTYSNGSWVDRAENVEVAEEDLFDRYHDAVLERCGIRTYADDGNLAGGSAPLLVSVYLDQDLTFTVETESEARAMVNADPEHTRIAPAGDAWAVTRAAGTEIRVPRRFELTRTVGGQIPTGFDPRAYGIGADMLESLDRVAVWNLVCTVEAFLAGGFTPAELMRWVHPVRVANTQGTGMGGMNSMQSLYLDTLMGESKPNDLLQEALPNVIAAHVVQSYVGSYGSMIHPVAACATAAVSLEEGVDKIRLGKADVVVTGGFDDLGVEGMVGFADMSATADSADLTARGVENSRFSRANDRRRAGFVESQGGGTIMLARGDIALRWGLPVLGVVAYAASFADGVHTSIPAPGLGALGAAIGGTDSPLARGLERVGLGVDDVAVISKHDTSTKANDPNESELHERIAAALGRTEGNPLFVISQKTLTGHSKGGAAAFQTIGLCQTLASGVVPGNRSLDCVDPVLREHEHLVWPRTAWRAPGTLRAGLVTSLGFGHVAAVVAIAHVESFLTAVPLAERADYQRRARARLAAGRQRLVQGMLGQTRLYERPADRRFATAGDAQRQAEASLLLDPQARLLASERYDA